MRSITSTLILLLVLAGLGGYIYFVDSKTEPGSAEDREKPFGELSADDIEEVQIKSADGETSRVRKSDDTWQLAEPVEAPADESELSSVASNLATLEIQRVVDENGENLKEYGLDPARVEVAFKTKGQTADRRLMLGEKTPTGGDLYARVADQKRVFLVSSFLESTFNKNTFALRDKTILKFERDKVERLEVASGSTSIQLAKSGADWRIAAPIAARADYAAVEGAVERLSSARMQSIAAAEDATLSMYGLDRPSATMTVVTGSSRATLTLGKTENALVFAKDSSRPMIFTVAPTLKDDVVRELSEYRRKDLFDSRSFTTNRAEFRRGDDTIVLEKTKVDDKEVWRNAAGKDLDTSKVEDLLSKVSGLRAQSFETSAHPSLKMPALVVTVRFDDSKTETVTFGRADVDVFASRADEPGAAKLDAASLDEATKALDELK